MAALTDYAVTLLGITKCYGPTVAVDNLSLSVRAGELFAFLGPNGAGKTTTIKLITGLLRPDRGDIQVCGHHIGSNGVAAKAQLAYVPDQPFLYEKLTGRESLSCVADLYGLDNRRPDVVLQRLLARL